MTGQINMDSGLGWELFQLSYNDNYHNYVEVGTWNGEGSTFCLMQGIRERNDATLWSLESNRAFYDSAKEFWNTQSLTYNNLNLIYGRIVDIDKIFLKNELREIGELNDTQEIWYNNDVNDYVNCKNVLSDLPKEIDVLLLDGGEFSTYFEFKLLEERSKIIAMDDVNFLKCKKIREELLVNENWKLLKEDLNERNGYSIFIKVEKEY